MRLAFVLVLVAVALGYYLHVAPLPFDAEVGPWEVQPNPERVGVLTPNTLLSRSSLLGQAHGAETLVLGPDGRLYGGTADGWIVAVDRSTGETEHWANVRGRPLGLEFDKNGDLIVAEALKGLLRVNPTNKVITILSHYAEGRNINFADDVAIAEDGTIYFSDASSIPPTQNGCAYDPLHASLIDVITSKPRGRLLRYTKQGGTELLLDKIHFANGVTLAHDESYVLVCETPRARILRYWLKGPKAGTSDVFADGLPGLVDGVSKRTDGSGHFWAALVAPRNPLLEAMAPYPAIRSLVLKLKLPLIGKPHGHIVELDGQGRVVRSLEGDTQSITAVTEVERLLYFGHLHAPSITTFKLSSAH